MPAYDDSRFAPPAPIAIVTLVLNKRFRGRFLLIESEIGVIGRNLLNHVRLLLDGPALSWAEFSSEPRNAAP